MTNDLAVRICTWPDQPCAGSSKIPSCLRLFPLSHSKSKKNFAGSKRLPAHTHTYSYKTYLRSWPGLAGCGGAAQQPGGQPAGAAAGHAGV